MLIDCGQAIVALYHLHFGSVTVSPAQQVQASDTLGRCDISGNSAEPHLHVQASDDMEVSRAAHVQWLITAQQRHRPGSLGATLATTSKGWA